MEKKKLKLPVIVEGKYDKITLSSIYEGVIISVGGFSVFNSKEKQALLKKISANGIVILTDSDGGGRQLRAFVSSILPTDKVFNAYIPKIEGKERRKLKRSKEGLLGVEGMSSEVLDRVLLPFTQDGVLYQGEEITMSEFYADGFTGGEDSAERRALLARHLGLPEDMSAKALLRAVNLLSLRDDYKVFVKTQSGDNDD